MLFYSDRPSVKMEDHSNVDTSPREYRIPLRPREPHVNIIIPPLRKFPKYSPGGIRTDEHRRMPLSPTGPSPTTSYFPHEHSMDTMSAPSTAPSSPMTPLSKLEFGDPRIRRDSCKTEMEFEEKPTLQSSGAGVDGRIKLPGIRDLFRDEWDMRQGQREPTPAKQPEFSCPPPRASIPAPLNLHQQQQYQPASTPASPYTPSEPYSALWGQRRPSVVEQISERRHSAAIQHFHIPRESERIAAQRMAWQRRSMHASPPGSLRYHPAAAPRHMGGGPDLLILQHRPPHQPHLQPHHAHYAGVKKNKGHCNIRYEPDQMDFILYHFMDKGLSWKEVVARYDATWPNGVKRDRQGLQGVFYRWNTRIPVLDNEGTLVFKPNGWIKKMAIARRKQDKVGCKRDYGLVKRCPENAVKHAWVDAEDRRIAAELVRDRERQREAEAQRRLALGLPVRTKEDDDENQPASPMQLDASFESSEDSIVMDMDDDEQRFTSMNVASAAHEQ